MNNEFTLSELNLLSVILYKAKTRQEEMNKKYSPHHPGAIPIEEIAALHEKVYAMLEARVKRDRNEITMEKKVTFMHGDEELTMLITIL